MSSLKVINAEIYGKLRNKIAWPFYFSPPTTTHKFTYIPVPVVTLTTRELYPPVLQAQDEQIWNHLDE